MFERALFGALELRDMALSADATSRRADDLRIDVLCAFDEVLAILREVEADASMSGR
jgi:hypothetical protein